MGEQAKKICQPTAGSEPGGGFLLLSPLQRRSSRRTWECKPGAQVMNQENVAEEAAERRPAPRSGEALCSGGVGNSRSKIVAFKFGGSSLLGAERMFHASGLVR